MKTIKDYIKELEHFDADDVYDYVLELGSETPKADIVKNESTFVPGCVSQVYVIGEEGALGWNFSLDSDSYMVRGIGSIIVECLSGMTTDELSAVTWADFEQLSRFFSQQRKQGMQAIINKCKQISRGE